MFVSNALGTWYGYEWYRLQLIDTWQHYAKWLVWFVPDSPTASLFFTLSLVYLLIEQHRKTPLQHGPAGRVIRGLIEALAIVTSVKYGIWAVAMIVASAAQGEPLVWEHYMLIASHLAMAVEVLLYGRFYSFTLPTVAVAAVWTITNDWIDYTFGVFPWLSSVLHDDLGVVSLFTVSLGILGVACAVVLYWTKSKNSF
ncbi:DUF1405 domain-containing protein [Paenibacillus turpanensis]|uniref:DUF1405 domain-containing protein n=1 Tax=Paenibacillus turpanensis TaxID=2689078 RepID=UPI001FB72C5F|nr:DUF1405 domain-containing protein [Paenibacillus turpanensis]